MCVPHVCLSHRERMGKTTVSHHPTDACNVPPNIVGETAHSLREVRRSPANERLARHLRLHRSCEHISLNIVYYAAFFVKKVGTKKAFRGIAPRSLPPCTVKNLPSSHSLLLCHHLKWGAVAKEIHVHRSQLRDRPCGLYPTFELRAVACGVPLLVHPPWLHRSCGHSYDVRSRGADTSRISLLSIHISSR